VTDRRGAIPFALLGVLGVLVLGAGAVGLVAGPSQEQIDLQIAAQQTAAAKDFSFTLSVELGSSGPLSALSVRDDGVWESPDRWRVVNVHSGSTSVTTGRGLTMRVSGSGGGHSLTFQLPSDALSSFSDPNSPVLVLPPLGLLYSATHVTRTGDVYDFVVPHLYLASGWVAYAPLSQRILPLSLIVAHDVRAEAVIRGSYVVMLAFPRGIHASHSRLTEIAVWHISDIGSTSFRRSENGG
jgi:hypothetical protein